ncbi:MAG TPA: hypothetical protein DEO57_08680 [Phycisphaerales bacterium]|nr:hypothetical protein [Phycisphaerales bacterium]
MMLSRLNVGTLNLTLATNGHRTPPVRMALLTASMSWITGSLRRKIHFGGTRASEEVILAG